jgi:hypothetical protein
MQATTAEPERRWAKGRRVIVTIFRLFVGAVGLFVGAVGLFVGAVSLFAAALGIFNEWPRPTVEPTNAPEASNPFSGIFKVANPRFYPLDDVRIEAYLWCAKIGRGTDTTAPTMCKRGMASSKREWNKRTLAADDSYEIDVGGVLFATPSALLYADISVKVSYTPWVVRYSFDKEFRFYTRRKDDGGIEWLHKPLD